MSKKYVVKSIEIEYLQETTRRCFADATTKECFYFCSKLDPLLCSFTEFLAYLFL